MPDCSGQISFLRMAALMALRAIAISLIFFIVQFPYLSGVLVRYADIIGGMPIRQLPIRSFFRNYPGLVSGMIIWRLPDSSRRIAASLSIARIVTN
jgi:hypothetical protein